MDVREKLVELIGSTEYGNGSLVGKNFQKGFIEKISTISLKFIFFCFMMIFILSLQ